MYNNYSCVNCKRKLILNNNIYSCVNCKINFLVKNDISILLNSSLDSFKESEALFHDKEAENFSDKNRKNSIRVSKYHDDYLLYFEKLNKGSLVLEIGCGGGIESYRLSKIGLNIMVSDISIGMVKKAKSIIQNDLNDDSINFLVCDAEDLPFSNNSIDSILIVASLHHLPNPDIFFREASRVLKPEGLLVIGFEPNRWPYYTVYPFMRLIGKFLKKTSRREDDVSIGDIETEGFVRKDFTNFVAHNNLEITRIQRIWFINGFVHTALARLNKNRNVDDIIDIPDSLQRFIIIIDQLISYIPIINNLCWHWNIILKNKSDDKY